MLNLMFYVSLKFITNKQIYNDHVPDKPTVHITRDETPVLEDGSGSINLTCSAESNPPVEGKWYKEADTSVAQYTDVIQYNPVTRHQAGTYVCRDVREDEDRGGGLV